MHNNKIPAAKQRFRVRGSISVAARPCTRAAEREHCSRCCLYLPRRITWSPWHYCHNFKLMSLWLPKTDTQTLFCYKGVRKLVMINDMLKLLFTSMMMPGDPGRLGTPICISTVESPQPVGARHTACTHLLWKPHNPSREVTPIYLVIFETSRPVGSRNTSCKQLLWKPRDPSREGTPIYLVTFETSLFIIFCHFYAFFTSANTDKVFSGKNYPVSPFPQCLSCNLISV
jgi:hypothetical protein